MQEKQFQYYDGQDPQFETQPQEQEDAPTEEAPEEVFTPNKFQVHVLTETLTCYPTP